MNIAVNTRQLPGYDSQDKPDPMLNCFSVLAKKYPQHRFIYIFDRVYDQKFITSENIIPVVAGPEARTPLRLQYWFNYKVPGILRKYEADVFVSMDGVCSLRTKIAQCLLINDLSYINYPQYKTKSIVHFYKKFTPKFLAKADAIAVTSESLKKDIEGHYSIAPEKIRMVYKSATPIFKVADQKEKESIKEKYTDGKEYFLYAGTVQSGKNLLNLLKAYSFFKKRQKSSMQLLIAGTAVSSYNEFANDLKTFKFRNEVKWLGDLSEDARAKVIAGAYAMVYPVFIEDNNPVVMEAMQCDVPVIVSTAVNHPESFAGAVLHVDPNDFMDIADKMMLLFKDENKRNELIRTGKAAIQKMSPGKTADMLWQCIIASIKKETA